MKHVIALSIYLVFILNFQVHATESDDAHAIILNYTRIGEQNYPDTNTLIEQFEAQINYLEAEEFNIVSLQHITSTLLAGERFDKKTIALTFDGGYESINNILPIILEEKIPVTIFLALGAIDRGSPQYLSEKEIKKLAKKDFIDFQVTTNAFNRLSLDKEDILSQINHAKSAYRAIFDQDPIFFAYPYGEYNLAAQTILQEQNFQAAFAQHSSPVTGNDDLFNLPRFAMSEEYGDIDRFSLIANSYPLNVTQFSPKNPILQESTPAIGFSLETPLQNKDDLSCYLSNIGNLDLTFLDDTRVEIRLPEPLTDRRSRLNCTYPFVKDDKRYWRWYGRLFILPQDELLSLQE